MKQSDLDELIDKCLSELKAAAQGTCKPERAEKNAALLLEAQIRLSEYVSNAELQAKMSKNELERLSSQKYFEYKQGTLGGDKKITEAALEHAISKDENICKLKDEVIKHEAEYKKWNYIINILSNGHVFFRNLGKREYNL